MYASVADLLGDGRKVEALDKVSVVEEGSGLAQGAADGAVVLPVGARRAVPEEVDGVASPSLRDLHAVIQIGGGAQLGEDADEDFVGQAVNRRKTNIVNLHVLEVGDAER